MQDATVIRNRKRRSSRCVVAGASLIAVALVLSVVNFTDPLVTTIGALVGFAFILYGVHLGWLVFYEREPDGPSS
jgi:1,4-dihydroxy-2-naphthoate octaprenyltransferase